VQYYSFTENKNDGGLGQRFLDKFINNNKRLIFVVHFRNITSRKLEDQEEWRLGFNLNKSI